MRSCIALLLLLSVTLAQAQSTSLRQSRILVGDIAEMVIVYEADIPSMYAIDTAPLDADFTVLDTRSRVSRVQSGNRSYYEMRWSVSLLPRRNGRLVIPALQFGDNFSERLELVVEPVTAALQAAQDVFVEIEAIPPAPYPGQQTRIVTRLFHNLPLLDIALGEPEYRAGPVFRSGRDRRYLATRNGITFNVLERSILLTPLSSGGNQIMPASFSGSLNALSDGVDLEGGIRYLHRRSNALQLEVRALPTDADTSNWLPASQLAMTLDWDAGRAGLKPGDTLGLTLTLEAAGLPAEALPTDLLLRDNNQFKIYADQVSSDTRVEVAAQEEFLLGQVQQRYAIVFSQSGQITFPGLQLDWWDTEHEEWRVARLEATSLSIGAADRANNPMPWPDYTDPHNSADSVVRLLPGLTWGWLWIGLALLLAIVIWRSRLLPLQAGFATLRKQRSLRQRLEWACINNDAAAARQALLLWSRLRWRDTGINSLRQIAERNVESAAWVDELARLDAAVFSATANKWDGQGLLQLLGRRHHASGVKPGNRQNRLPDPYSAQLLRVE